ncbi:MAG: hypothetical protein M3Q34_03755 [bacterium]|nr:hypothetical protein [bacterium]
MNNKNVQYLAIGLTLILIAGIIWFSKPKVNPEEVVINTETDTNPGIQLCFAKFGKVNERGFYDKHTLKMLLKGENVTGELKFLPAEKDSKLGKFEGTVSAVDKIAMARTVNAIWPTFSEGVFNKEELSIMFGEGTARVGFGEMVARADGVYGYKDPANIAYSLELNDVACGDIDERELVENHLRTNITTLSPVKATMGGTWQVFSAYVDMSKNEGKVVYEDGHMQEKRTFTYTTNEKSEVVTMTIK